MNLASFDIDGTLTETQEKGFARIVSIGDGLWDVRTARKLNFPFLGIGSGAREEELRRAGATHVLQDFADYDGLIQYLEEAEVPRAETGHFAGG